jgi:hypothetical protein
MVVMRSDTVREAQQARGWDDYRLASEAGISYQQVRNLFAGIGCGAKSQQGIYEAFGETIPMAELFSIVPDAEQGADSNDHATADDPATPERVA